MEIGTSKFARSDYDCILNVENNLQKKTFWNLPFETKALSYNFVASDTTGKLFLDDKHFSLSMNNELDLIFKSCSSFALFMRRSWWELSASFNCKCKVIFQKIKSNPKKICNFTTIRYQKRLILYVNKPFCWEDPLIL